MDPQILEDPKWADIASLAAKAYESIKAGFFSEK